MRNSRNWGARRRKDGKKEKTTATLRRAFQRIGESEGSQTCTQEDQSGVRNERGEIKKGWRGSRNNPFVIFAARHKKIDRRKTTFLRNEKKKLHGLVTQGEEKKKKAKRRKKKNRSEHCRSTQQRGGTRGKNKSPGKKTTSLKNHKAEG